MPVRVNLTVVTHNRLPLTRLCLQSVAARTPRAGVRITVVDNASTDGTLEWLEAFRRAGGIDEVIPLGRNMGLSVASNVGWAAVDADFYVKIDNDMEMLRPDWLEALVEVAAANPEVGMLGYRFCDWHRPEPRALPSGHVIGAFPLCGGGCVLIPRTAHARLGFWNEDYGLYGHEDLEYGNRAALAGFVCGYVPREDMVAHRGPEVPDPGYEERKARHVRSLASGEQLFMLNTFMFEKGLRELFVTRKYLPVPGSRPVAFSLNEAYRPIMQRQKYLRSALKVSREGGRIRYEFAPGAVPGEALVS